MGDITLKILNNNDDEFLFKVFKESRPDLNFIHDEKIISDQYLLEKNQVKNIYPNASCNLILLNEKPIGRFYLNDEKAEVYFIELGILEEYRNKGIGTSILTDAINIALKDNKKIYLKVAWFNVKAYELYVRLGFKIIKNNAAFYEMQYMS